jgi:hypothetical protein
MYLTAGTLSSIFRKSDSSVRPTFFFHIPKCAGSSVWESIFDIYGFFGVFVVSAGRDAKRLAGMPEARRMRFGAIGGHGSLPEYRELLGDLERYHKIVVFRDPTDRLISEYQYIRRTKGHFLYDLVSKQSFAEFVSEGWRNTQVRILTGREDDVSGAIETVTNFFDDWAFIEDSGDLVERLYTMANRSPRPIKHKNKAGDIGARKIERSPEILKLMQECQSGDLALFEHLKSIRSLR